jgi:hypothetical protein
VSFAYLSEAVQRNEDIIVAQFLTLNSHNEKKGDV